VISHDTMELHKTRVSTRFGRTQPPPFSFVTACSPLSFSSLLPLLSPRQLCHQPSQPTCEFTNLAVSLVPSRRISFSLPKISIGPGVFACVVAFAVTRSVYLPLMIRSDRWSRLLPPWQPYTAIPSPQFPILSRAFEGPSESYRLSGPVA
jgi:hypothetical protein